MAAECVVFTYKDGLLSPIAHDLELRVERFTLEATPTAVSARFDPTSLRVMKPASLSAKDRRTIEETIVGEVLQARRFPEIRFESSSVTADGDGHRVSGLLTLHGRSKTIDARVRREGDRWVCELVLHQPDFGIRPYTAMLGTLKIKPDVRIRITSPVS
jgi:polyisoprenoid-binding protein YceI